MKTTNTFKWEEDKPINNTEGFKQPLSSPQYEINLLYSFNKSIIY